MTWDGVSNYEIKCENEMFRVECENMHTKHSYWVWFDFYLFLW